MAEEQLIWIWLREELDRLRRRVEFDWAFADILWAQIEFYYCHDLADGSSSIRHRFEGMAVENPFRTNFRGVNKQTLDLTACTIQLDTEKPRQILVCQADSEDWFRQRVNDIRGARASPVQSITNSSTLTIGSVLNSTIAPNTSQSGNTNTAHSAPQPPMEQPEAEAEPSAGAAAETDTRSQISPTLAAFIAAEGGPGSPQDRLERQIMAWLDVLHKEQPQARPNLEEKTVRERWREELKPRGVLQQTVLTLYGSPSCKYMRGNPGERNRA